MTDTERALARAWKARAKMYSRKLDWYVERHIAWENLAAALRHADGASHRLAGALRDVAALATPGSPEGT